MVEVIEKVLNHSLINIKIIWKHREFVFDYVHLMYCKCHKIWINLIFKPWIYKCDSKGINPPSE